MSVSPNCDFGKETPRYALFAEFLFSHHHFSCKVSRFKM